MRAAARRAALWLARQPVATDEQKPVDDDVGFPQQVHAVDALLRFSKGTIFLPRPFKACWPQIPRKHGAPQGSFNFGPRDGTYVHGTVGIVCCCLPANNKLNNKQQRASRACTQAVFIQIVRCAILSGYVMQLFLREIKSY